MTDPTLPAGADAAAYAQTAAGAVLLATPYWAQLLYTINTIAATVASLCGAVVGLIGLWRILRRKRGQP